MIEFRLHWPPQIQLCRLRIDGYQIEEFRIAAVLNCVDKTECYLAVNATVIVFSSKIWHRCVIGHCEWSADLLIEETKAMHPAAVWINQLWRIEVVRFQMHRIYLAGSQLHIGVPKVTVVERLDFNQPVTIESTTMLL